MQPTSIRIPEEIKQKIIEMAKRDLRNFNQEIIWILKNHIEQDSHQKD